MTNRESHAELKRKARRLRRQGLSYKEIRERGIGVSKGTLSLWLKDIPLKPDDKARLYTKQTQILARGAFSQKERRRREIDGLICTAMTDIELPLSEQAFKLFGVALYWGEGNKTQKFGITNSDPYLIAFMVTWLQSVFHIDPKTLKPHLNIYPQQDEFALKNFWSEITGIPVANFGKSYVKPANKNYKKNNLYYGTMHLYVPKAVNLMHIVYGWRKAVLQNLENKVDFTERKWVSLRETPRPVNLADEDDTAKPL